MRDLAWTVFVLRFLSLLAWFLRTRWQVLLLCFLCTIHRFATCSSRSVMLIFSFPRCPCSSPLRVACFTNFLSRISQVNAFERWQRFAEDHSYFQCFWFGIYIMNNGIHLNMPVRSTMHHNIDCSRGTHGYKHWFGRFILQGWRCRPQNISNCTQAGMGLNVKELEYAYMLIYAPCGNDKAWFYWRGHRSSVRDGDAS